MPMNDVRDEAYLSGNPAKTGFPLNPAPSLAPWQQGYIENASTPAAYGNLVRLYVNATNTGGAFFSISVSSAEVMLPAEFGIVAQAASAKLSQGVMTYQGMAYALCTTTGTAIAVGTLLSSDGAGNLTPAPGSPTPGQLLARSLGTLAGSTSTPTLTLVYVGGA